MIAFRSAAVLCVCVCGSVLAQQTNVSETITITIGGVTYSNVTWGMVTPATVTIFHKTGVARIPLEELSPELQQKFGYDREKARTYRAQEAAALQRQAAADRAAQEKRRQQQSAAQAEAAEAAKIAPVNCTDTFRAQVIQVLPEGQLVRVLGATVLPSGEVGMFFSEPKTWFVRPRYQVAMDDWITVNARRDGVYEYQSVLGAPQTVQNWVACKIAVDPY